MKRKGPTPMELRRQRLEIARGGKADSKTSLFASVMEGAGGNRGGDLATDKSGAFVPTLSQRLTGKTLLATSSSIVDEFFGASLSKAAVSSTTPLNESGVKSGVFEPRDRLLKEHELEIDWSLKTFVRLLSPRSFDWSYGISSRMQCNGISKACEAASRIMHCACTQTSDELKATFHSALTSWVYPEAPLPNAFVQQHLVAIKAAKPSPPEQEIIAFIAERRNLWLQAFRSAYMTLRNGLSTSLYYISAQFTVLFTRANLYQTDLNATSTVSAGHDEGHDSKIANLVAVISRSNDGLRRALRDNDIIFSCPWDEGLAKSLTEDLESANDLKLLAEESGRPSGISGAGQTANDRSTSLLLVEGTWNVHGLYNFLMDHHKGAMSRDVPQMISSSPFDNAVSRHAKITQNAMIPGHKGNPNSYSMHITGTLLPKSINALLAVFRQTQHCLDDDHEEKMVDGSGDTPVAYSATFTTDQTTAKFNGPSKDVLKTITCYDESGCNAACFEVNQSK